MTLEPGDRAPDFALPDDSGATVTLSDFAGKRLVVYFYPKAFTPGCTTQACDLRDHHASFETAGYAVVGVSPDPVDRLSDFRAEYDLPFPLLSDEDNSTARAYGAFGPKRNYGREYEGLIRSTFIIGPDGTVEQVWRNVRAQGHAERLMRVAAGE
jgi:thioredoxin-dependent peroxiredoxin